MKKAKQAKFNFNTQAAAEIFVSWLKTNCNNRDYGYPMYINMVQIVGAWDVEYRYENEMARGVATGIEFAAMHS